jgi:hypothetical protein
MLKGIFIFAVILLAAAGFAYVTGNTIAGDILIGIFILILTFVGIVIAIGILTVAFPPAIDLKKSRLARACERLDRLKKR